MSLQLALIRAKDNLRKEIADYKFEYDKKVRGWEFAAGDRVFLCFPKTRAPQGSSHKLWLSRRGPYRIISLDQYPVVSLRLSDHPKSKEIKAHVDRLVPCGYNVQSLVPTNQPKPEEQEKDEEGTSDNQDSNQDLTLPPNILALPPTKEPRYKLRPRKQHN